MNSLPTNQDQAEGTITLEESYLDYTLTDKPITCETCGESQPLDNALDWHMTVQFTCPTCQPINAWEVTQ